MSTKASVEDAAIARATAGLDPAHAAALRDGSWQSVDDWCPQCHDAGLSRRHAKCHPA